MGRPFKESRRSVKDGIGQTLNLAAELPTEKAFACRKGVYRALTGFERAHFAPIGVVPRSKLCFVSFGDGALFY